MKLTDCFTYDAIGNPLNDGERAYTWGAGRQLRHISMRTGEAHGVCFSNGEYTESGTLLRIVRSGNLLSVKVFRGEREITDECAASAFVWTKSGSPLASAVKQVSVSDEEINGDVLFSCAYTETQGMYGTVSVDNNLVASHTPATADANHEFTLENGILKVNIPNSAGNGTDYELTDGVLSVNPGFTGTITAEYEFTTNSTREIDFEYDHNGLRTRKKVVENGVTTTYDYTLHGKLITHLTKRVVTESGAETTETLHFFYDAQSRPAFVEYNGAMYRYVHNLQGDIVAIVDSAGNTVVEYKYDVWGNIRNTSGIFASSLGRNSPFRYRSYIQEEETELYYLKSRYYNAQKCRFISVDAIISDGFGGLNLLTYCQNNPVTRADSTGTEGYYVVLNVYDASAWNWWNGHYDLSIISKDDPSIGRTYSYGPIIPKSYDRSKINEYAEFDARVDVYDAPHRPDVKARIRFILFSDFSDSEFSGFNQWIESGMKLIADSDIEGTRRRRYKVDKGFYKKYNISMISYCGSGLVYLVANMGSRYSSSKNAQIVFDKLLNYVLKVDNHVIDMFSNLLPIYSSD